MVDDKLYKVPCQCAKCGTFYFSGIQLAGGYLKRYWGDKDKPYLTTPVECPKCGTFNQMDPSLIDLIEGAIDTFKLVPIDELLKLEKKLKAKQSGSFTLQDFENTRRDILQMTPELQSLRDFKPKTRNEAYVEISQALTSGFHSRLITCRFYEGSC